MTRRELEMSLQDLFEGMLEGEDFVRLENELRENPAARETYREYARLEHALKFRGKGVDLLRVVPMEQVVLRRQRRGMKRAVFAAAAVLLAGMVVMAFFMAQEPQPTLALTPSPGTEMELSHLISSDGQPVGRVMEPGSRLVVRHGTVELEFATGVRGIVRAPAEVKLVRDDFLELQSGTAWFDVPPNAVGFQVRTPDMVLTDLGTQFGLITQPGELDEAHVFSGKVEVLNRHGLKHREVLEAGQARKAGAAGHWDEQPLNHEAFLKKLPKSEMVAIAVDATATFTSSPGNELTRQSRYEFSADGPLAGFDPADSDKLIVTLSHERGEIKRVTYGGVRMSLATEVSDDPKSPLQRTSIYYLDSPETTGNLVVEIMDRPSNGVGGSLIAVSNVAVGEPVIVEGRRGSSLRLSQVPENALIVASHACNDNRQGAGVGAAARSPLTPLFDGPTGSNVGASGYHVMKKSGSVTVNFAGTDIRPVTAAAVFVSGG